MKYSLFSTQLHNAASAATGLEDFGDDDDGYRVALDKLISSVENEVDLTDLGKAMYPQILIGALVGRLMAAKGLADHPEVPEQAIAKPIIVTGFTRSGTTALHRLLTSVPRVQTLEYWLASTPMIRPPRDTWEANPFFQQTVMDLDQLNQAVPDIKKMHDMQAHKADECRLILAQSFMTYALMGFLWAPSYGKWVIGADRRGAYARYARLLRLIGLNNSNRWVLKCPMHISAIDMLLEQFPDACIVHTCREPTEVIPSTCSLMYNVAKPIQHLPDKKDFGPQVLDDYARQMDMFMEQRKSLDPARFLEVRYEDFTGDPVGTAMWVFRHFDVPVDAADIAALNDWKTKNAQNKHGKHDYSGEEYGLTDGKINDRLADYRKEYLGK